MNTTTLLRKAGVAEKAIELLLQKSVSAAERKKDYHAGPGDSFPIGPAGQHLAAAWDLAGHAANPDEVRANILRFAHEHGLMAHLPQAARDHMKKKKIRLSKARNDDLTNLFDLAYHHEDMEGDTYQKRQLIRYAEQHGLTHHLPEDAHGLMHEMGVAHNHEGMRNDPETGLHHHTITKAFNPQGWNGVVLKAWSTDDGYMHFEGWNATPAKDLEKDVTEATAFIPAMKGFFSRAAPLSLEHNGKSLPVGHLQKAAVVKDGKILAEEYHPSDPGEFENFPGIGTGVWVRGVVNEEPGISALRKGNVRGMSFIANATEVEPLPGGRHRYLKLDPWIESTIAAYPINPQAVIAVAKAFGLQEPPTQEEVQDTMPMTIEEVLIEAQKQLEAEKKAENSTAITKADLGAVLGQFKTSLLDEVKTVIGEQVEEVKKAIPEVPPVQQRGEGVGRKGQIEPSTAQTEDPREKDPLNYIVEKASKAVDSSTFDETDMALLNWLIYEALTDGLKKD